ncbi:DUF6111 family protein [Salinarimonas ramus]|uniref:Uncharacterized protein n=1 Tax=Salinarimonas ramus TaxID=690164 RepID=A0A917Q9J8_9HYPH|nr:DUF6111 family protein [Salinarimonas ramus]GGK37347.1 hypothetical protein GCM10011322_25510 [Salinarimonas ramus]
MTRVLLQQAVIFFLPFVAFFVYLLLRRRNPLAFAHWERSIPPLAVAGLVLVVAALVYTGVVAPRSTGVYVPPSYEAGEINPGRFD